MRLLAAILAWVLFLILARLWREWTAAHPSPGEGPGVIEWVKALVSGDPDPEPEPARDPASVRKRGRRGYRLRQVSEARTEVDWVPEAGDLPPAVPLAPEESRIHRWIRASFAGGARYGQVLTEGQRAFAVSESTMKREIRKARAKP